MKQIFVVSKEHWILKTKAGFEVYKTGVTHSTRCAVIGYTGEVGYKKALAHIKIFEGDS